MAIKAVLGFQLEIPYFPRPILIYLGRWGHGVFFIFPPDFLPKMWEISSHPQKKKSMVN
jgi:hypothetical protein